MQSCAALTLIEAVLSLTSLWKNVCSWCLFLCYPSIPIQEAPLYEQAIFDRDRRGGNAIFSAKPTFLLFGSLQASAYIRKTCGDIFQVPPNLMAVRLMLLSGTFGRTHQGLKELHDDPCRSARPDRVLHVRSGTRAPTSQRHRQWVESWGGEQRPILYLSRHDVIQAVRKRGVLARPTTIDG